ncbi:MAG: hypothetical protein ACK5OU_21525, partial [Dolichospermum sp.]
FTRGKGGSNVMKITEYHFSNILLEKSGILFLKKIFMVKFMKKEKKMNHLRQNYQDIKQNGI